MHEIWKPIKLNQYEDSVKINQNASADNKAELERMFCFMMIGTTIGPCGMFSGFLVLLKCKWLFAVIIMLFSFFLTLLSKVKILQIKQYEKELVNLLR